MMKNMTILSALLALILVDLLKAQGTPVTPVFEATSVEQSRDPSIQPSTELSLDYSRDPYKEEGTEQVGSNGVQEGEQVTWELSGEPSTEPTPEPSVDPSKEPTQESTTEISGPRNWVVKVFPDRLQMTSADCFESAEGIIRGKTLQRCPE